MVMVTLIVIVVVLVDVVVVVSGCAQVGSSFNVWVSLVRSYLVVSDVDFGCHHHHHHPLSSPNYINTYRFTCSACRTRDCRLSLRPACPIASAVLCFT
eukprot:3268602-Karenia_brevis.AAC.1